jgi:hypothetical protein
LHFVGREEDLVTLRQHLKEGQSVVLTGLPGVGKTALALALVHEEATRTVFEEILWASLGPAPNPLSHFIRWGNLLGLPDRQIARLDNISSWQEALRVALGKRRCLLVLDDVWSLADLRNLSVGGVACVSLAISRSHRIAMESFYHVATVHELDLPHSLQLLECLVPLLFEVDAHQARQLVLTVGGLPLALTIMGQCLLQQIYSGPSRRQCLRQALQYLGHVERRLHLGLVSSLQAPADPSCSLASRIRLSERMLSEQARQALSALAVFPPKPSSFSEEAACAVARVPVETLEELVDSGLVERAGAMRYLLHPVIADAVRLDQDAATIDLLWSRLIAYVMDFLETYTCAESTIALESPMILAALDAARASGKQTELAHAIHLFAPFLWKIALPLNNALSQMARRQEMPDSSQLVQVVIALADHLRCPQEQEASVFPSLSGGMTLRLLHPSQPESRGSSEVMPPRVAPADECSE